MSKNKPGETNENDSSFSKDTDEAKEAKEKIYLRFYHVKIY